MFEMGVFTCASNNLQKEPKQVLKVTSCSYWSRPQKGLVGPRLARLTITQFFRLEHKTKPYKFDLELLMVKWLVCITAIEKKKIILDVLVSNTNSYDVDHKSFRKLFYESLMQL